MPEIGQAGEPLSTPYGVNESVELVIDLLAATKLVPEDKLALARGRAQQTRSLAAALVEEGVASSEGIAKMLAARHQLPLIDLAAEAARLQKELAKVTEEIARLHGYNNFPNTLPGRVGTRASRLDREEILCPKMEL